MVASEVASVRTSSSSFMIGTGLKKCHPMQRSRPLTPSNTFASDSDDVLLASTHAGATSSPSSRKMPFLRSSFSGTASTTRSASRQAAARSVLVAMRCRTASALHLGGLALVDALLQKRADALHAFADELVVDVAQRDARSRLGADLCDARGPWCRRRAPRPSRTSAHSSISPSSASASACPGTRSCAPACRHCRTARPAPNSRTRPRSPAPGATMR